MEHWLSVINGPNLGKRYELPNGQGTIGRGPSNQVQLIDGEVSRIHCRFSLLGDRVKLADLDSSNGTHVNHVAIEQQHLLRSGDQILIGGTLLGYETIKTAEDEGTVTEESGTIDSSEDYSALESLPSVASIGKLLSDSGRPEGLVVDSLSQELNTDSFNDVARRMVQVSSDLNFMYHASLVTSSKTSLDQMLERVTELIFKWIAADRCCVLLREGDQRKLEVKSLKRRAESTNQGKLMISQSIVNYVRKNRVGILTSDAFQDGRLDGQGSIKNIGIREAICVPIQGRDEMLGLIYVDALDRSGSLESTRFNEDHLKLMIAIAHQIAFAIENDSYFAALLKQERLATIGQTTASLSHHIKNVLQGVNGGSHLIEEGLQDADLDMIRAGWQIVNRNQNEVSKLVNDMLIVGEPYHPNLVTADINGVIAKVLQQIEPHLKRRSVECIWQPSDNTPTFRFDPRGIHCALFNVLNSCSSACREVSNGRITIEVSQPDDKELNIAVMDNGLPMTYENPDDLFSPAKSPLGQKLNPVELAVSRKLVRGHGGDISVSHPDYGGNLFAIRLPLNPQVPADTRA